MKKKRSWMPILFLVFIIATGFVIAVLVWGFNNFEISITPNLAPTMTAQVPALEQGGQAPAVAPDVVNPSVTNTVNPPAAGAVSPSPTATNTATANNANPAAAGQITVTVSAETNCRKGPGASYASVYSLPVGLAAEVVGKNTASNYWIIKMPGGSTCWLWGQYATVTGDTASLIDVVTPTSVAAKKPTTTITATLSSSAAIAGCTDSTASNYNSAATVDNGTCTYVGPAFIGGCTDFAASNYNSAATADDGSCIYDVIITNASVACEDQLDGNYKFTYTIDWLKNNTLSGLEYFINYQWEEADETRRGDREVVPISTSPIIGTAIKPAILGLSIYISVVNPLTAERTSINPIKLTCP